MTKRRKLFLYGAAGLIVFLFVLAHAGAWALLRQIHVPEHDDVPVVWAAGQNWAPAQWPVVVRHLP